MTITFQGVIEIWEIYNKDNKVNTTLKYIENLVCSGITTSCKLNDEDVTDYKSINEDFKVKQAMLRTFQNYSKIQKEKTPEIEQQIEFKIISLFF